MSEPKPMLKPEQVAKRLNVARKTVYNYVHAKLLTATIIPGGRDGMFRFEAEDVEAFLVKRRRKAR